MVSVHSFHVNFNFLRRVFFATVTPLNKSFRESLSSTSKQEIFICDENIQQLMGLEHVLHVLIANDIFTQKKSPKTLLSNYCIKVVQLNALIPFGLLSLALLILLSYHTYLYIFTPNQKLQ